MKSIFSAFCCAVPLLLLALSTGCAGGRLSQSQTEFSGGQLCAQGELWQNLMLAGDKLGYRQRRCWRQGDEWHSDETLNITLKQPGAPLRRSETRVFYRESSDGRVLEIEKTLRGDSTDQQLRAWREDGRWWLQQGAETHSYAVPEDFLLGDGLRRALLALPEPRRQFRYSDWSFSLRRFVAMEITLQRASVERLSALLLTRPELIIDPSAIRWIGSRRSLDSAGQNSETLVLFDDQFRALHEITASGGDEMLLVGVDRATALASFSPVTHVYRQLIRSPYRISDHALRGTIRYQLGGGADLQPPTTFEQQVEREGETGWRLTICEGCGSEAAPTAAELERRLQSNYWLPAQHPELQAVIEKLLPDRGLAAASAMQRLTRFVEHRISVPSYAGYATALEGLRLGEGDCTEHALLLAALGRAAGVPTRVVFGLAYNNERFLGRRFVFVPHAWVQAWTGEHWQSFDSGLGRFNAGYIALALSDGDQQDILRVNTKLHRLSIDSAVQLRSR